MKPRPPNHTHPLVRRFFDELAKTGLTDAYLARKAGLNRRSVNNWRRHCNPTLPNFAAALNALGLELEIPSQDRN